MSLETFFKPSSIAIVGVSSHAKKVGHLVAKSMLDAGYEGKLYFVHPEGEEILGKKTYKTLSSIKKSIDLVVLAIPADKALTALDEIHAIGCHNAVLFAAGFKEIGQEGLLREKILIEKAKKYNITLLGPNCIGFINTHAKINATFLKHYSPVGNIGFVSQSGALGSSIVDYFAAHKNLGFSYFVSLGNKTVIDESDVLEFLLHDKNTQVIGMYLEDVKDGHKFRTILQKVTKIKPVVILKSGTTKEGSQAALSHTGGLIGDDQVYGSVFSQCGAIRAEHYEEFLALLKMCSFKQIPSSKEILVLSNAGGVGVLLADQLIQNKLALVMISEETKSILAKDFDAVKKISIHNPIDLLGDASAFDYQQAIAATLTEKEIGAVVILLTPQANTEIKKTAEVIAKAQTHFKKPIYPVFMGEKSVEGVHHIFEKKNIASFFSYDVLPVVLAKLLAYQAYLHKTTTDDSHFFHTLSAAHQESEIQHILTLRNGQAFLNLKDSMKVMELGGLPIVPLYHLQSLEHVASIVHKLHFPVVAKIASDEITHKTEVQGVITNINTATELEAAYHRLTQLSGGCLVQQMVKGYELFIGAKRDSHFGIVVVFGLGGIYAELLKEVAQVVYPFEYYDFLQGIEHSKLSAFIKGFRGLPPLDSRAFYVIVTKIAALMQRFAAIKEVDINPLMVTGKELLVVDSRIILEG